MRLFIFYLIFLIPSSVKGIEQAELDNLQKNIGNKTIYIECLKERNWHNGQGFIIRPDGYILTAKHLIEGSNQIYGSWIDSQGEEHIQKINLVAMHPRFDLALLKICAPENQVFSYFEFDEEPIYIHQWIFFGFYHIADKRFTLRGGKIMYIEFSSTLHSLPQAFTSFSTSEEDDGGPCFQCEGKIVGVLVGTQTIHVEFAKFLPYLEFKDWLKSNLNTINQNLNKSQKNNAKKKGPNKKNNTSNVQNVTDPV